MKKYTWEPIWECDDDDDNPTTWATEANSDKYGKFVWIVQVNDNEYEITTSRFDVSAIMICKSLASAKRWVAMNIR